MGPNLEHLFNFAEFQIILISVQVELWFSGKKMSGFEVA
jgi:hypothetical protein